MTGHRRIDDAATVVARCKELLDRLDDVVVVSSLAEGADRLVAQLAVARGNGLEVVLPLEIDDYERDFPDTVDEFRTLLAAAASTVVIPPQPTREDAYLAAGLAVLDRADVLVAIWDGEAARGRGGTAEIVEEARLRGVAVEWGKVGSAST